jgi:hypothetical protein
MLNKNRGCPKSKGQPLPNLREAWINGGKKRKQTAPVFKPYVMNQVALLPPSYEE